MSPVTLPQYDWSTGAGLEKTETVYYTQKIGRLEVSTHRMFTETINTLLLLLRTDTFRNILGYWPQFVKRNHHRGAQG